MFVNRIEELNYLEKSHKEQGARFVIMYGRRRIGKTELLSINNHPLSHFLIFYNIFKLFFLKATMVAEVIINMLPTI